MKKNEILRRIPKIDEVLKAGGLELLFAGSGRTVVTEAARSVIQDLRNEILKMSPEELEEFDVQRMDIEAVANRVIAYMEQEDCNNLYPVINATGTILHTNLGRAPLCKGPVEKLADMIRDFPAEDIWEMERYAEFLASRREPKKKKATTGPMGTELPENWRRA